MTFRTTHVFLLFTVVGNEQHLDNVTAKWYADVTRVCHTSVRIILLGVVTQQTTHEERQKHRERAENLVGGVGGITAYVEYDRREEENLDGAFKEVWSPIRSEPRWAASAEAR